MILNAAPAGFCADAGMLGTLEGLTVLAARDGAFTAAELNAVMTNLAEDVRLLKGVVFTMARRTRFDAARLTGLTKEEPAMDLLKTFLVYMSMVVAASVQNAPDPGAMPAL